MMTERRSSGKEQVSAWSDELALHVSRRRLFTSIRSRLSVFEAFKPGRLLRLPFSSINIQAYRLSCLILASSTHEANRHA